MRALEGDRILVRIFIGEASQWHHQPLDRALLERLRKEGFAGATVLRALAGFGARSVIHTAHLVDLSADLPIVIEVVESEDRIEPLKAILDEMVPHGLVTMEKVHVLRYAPKGA